MVETSPYPVKGSDFISSVKIKTENIESKGYSTFGQKGDADLPVQ
jgi:hypothetical protein